MSNRDSLLLSSKESDKEKYVESIIIELIFNLQPILFYFFFWLDPKETKDPKK
jgi:hypothetical protein